MSFSHQTYSNHPTFVSLTASLHLHSLFPPALSSDILEDLLPVLQCREWLLTPFSPTYSPCSTNFVHCSPGWHAVHILHHGYLMYFTKTKKNEGRWRISSCPVISYPGLLLRSLLPILHSSKPSKNNLHPTHANFHKPPPPAPSFISSSMKKLTRSDNPSLKSSPLSPTLILPTTVQLSAWLSDDVLQLLTFCNPTTSPFDPINEKQLNTSSSYSRSFCLFWCCQPSFCLHSPNSESLVGGGLRATLRITVIKCQRKGECLPQEDLPLVFLRAQCLDLFSFCIHSLSW